MPRRARINKRAVVHDAKYDSETVAKLINRIMKCGKKSVAERVIYDAMDAMAERESRDALSLLGQAIQNATPLLEVKPRRVGGATYQVPVEVDQERGLSLALRWLIASSRKRSGKSMSEKLAAEFLDAIHNQGATIKKREDTHKMAEANRAFAHYRW